MMIRVDTTVPLEINNPHFLIKNEGGHSGHRVLCLSAHRNLYMYKKS